MEMNTLGPSPAGIGPSLPNTAMTLLTFAAVTGALHPLQYCLSVATLLA